MRRTIGIYLGWVILIGTLVGVVNSYADRSRIVRFQDAVSYLADQGYDAGYDAGDVLGNDQGVDGGYDVGLDASFQIANASDDYVTCSDRAGYDTSANGKLFSAGCWARRTALENSEMLFSQTDNAADLKFALQAQDSTGGATYDDITVYMADSSSSWRSCPTNVNMVVDTWYLIVGVYDADATGDEVSLSVNGAARGHGTCSGSVPTTLRNSAGPVSIGHYADASNSVFAWNGQIGPCYIWNVALSNAQLTTLYNSGTPLPYTSISPAPTFMINGCTHNGTGGYPNVAPETGGADCIATNGPTCVSTFPP